MWGHMTGWNGWGGAGMFGIVHLLWWALLIAGVVVLARWLLSTRRQRNSSEDRALAILRERFARGEIDKAAFEALKRDLA